MADAQGEKEPKKADLRMLHIKPVNLDDSPQNIMVRVDPVEAPGGGAGEAAEAAEAAEAVPLKAPTAITTVTTVATNTINTDSPQPPSTSTTLSLENVNEFLEYREVDQMVNNAYYYKESNNSTVLDIIAIYLKGQKMLYTESKTFCEQRLNVLMLPAIFITSLCAILSLVLKDQSYGSIIVSSFNGINAFILALINYLKLDGKAEAHKSSAYKFDKLQAYVEFKSGKVLFLTGCSNDIGNMIEDIEEQVKEIKETNQFILPEVIRYSFPKLYSTNVFAEVKRVMNNEILITNRLKDVLNDITETRAKADSPAKEAKLELLEVKKRNTLESIISMRNEYLQLDRHFEKEMKEFRHRLSRYYDICGWLKT